MLYTAGQALFYYINWRRADESGENFTCKNPINPNDDGSDAWIYWMHISWISCLILTGATAFVVVSGYVTRLRIIAGLIVGPAEIFNLYVLYNITVARYSDKGKGCYLYASELNDMTPGEDLQVYKTGTFLRRIILTTWMVLIAHCWAICAGNCA